MIPDAFEYHRPKSVPDALIILATHGDMARVIAGGHSLIPVMKQRLTEISHLIDLQDIDDLKGVSVRETIRIGAMTTQHTLITHAGLADAVPLLAEAALQIADPQVRYMGTIGGNVANGDPGNDMPGLMMCLDAQFVLEGPDGTRTVAAREFYQGAYVTLRAEDEILVAIEMPRPSGGYAYEKQKRKIGDYATAAAAVQIASAGGYVTAASVAMTNLSDVPVWSEAAGAALVGTDCGPMAVKAAVEAMLADINPSQDNRGPVEFKRHVAGVVLGRAIARARARC